MRLTNDERQVVDAVRRLLEEGDLQGVLAFLNERTPHRFTGAYRFDSPQLRNIALFDRNNPGLAVGQDAPLEETYCSMVGSNLDVFCSSDTREDPRLVEHPARFSTLSYCGAPLLSPEGEPFGSLCHFDLVPHAVPEAEIPILAAVAPLVSSFAWESVSGKSARPG